MEFINLIDGPYSRFAGDYPVGSLHLYSHGSDNYIFQVIEPTTGMESDPAIIKTLKIWRRDHSSTLEQFVKIFINMDNLKEIKELRYSHHRLSEILENRDQTSSEIRESDLLQVLLDLYKVQPVVLRSTSEHVDKHKLAVLNGVMKFNAWYYSEDTQNVNAYGSQRWATWEDIFHRLTPLGSEEGEDLKQKIKQAWLARKRMKYLGY